MLYNTLIKVLWLSYRLGLTFNFFFKYVVFYKVSSISYDIYLGHYPRIFNDQGLWVLFFKWRLYFLNEVYLFHAGVTFFLLLFLFYLFMLWPTFVETRSMREHLDKDFKRGKENKRVNKKEAKLKEVELSLDKKFGIDSSLDLKSFEKKLSLLYKIFKSNRKD